MRIRSGAAAVLAALTLLTACGDSKSTPTSPGSPSGTVETVSGNVGPYGTASHLIQVSFAGTMTVKLTWGGNADLDLYLTSADCTGYPPDACEILQRATASSGNSEQIQSAVAATTRYKIWVDNFSPTASVDYTITTEVR